jgi:hypothetical protein
MSNPIRALLIEVAPEDMKARFASIPDSEEVRISAEELEKWHKDAVSKDTNERKTEVKNRRQMRRQVSLEQSDLIKNRYAKMFQMSSSSSSSLDSSNDGQVKEKK